MLRAEYERQPLLARRAAASSSALCHALQSCMGIARPMPTPPERPTWLAAGGIPPNAYLAMAARPPPYMIQPDAFLFLPDAQYVFSPERIREAKRQCWQLLRVLVAQGKVERLVALCGAPGAGKSTWIERHARGEEGHRTAFYDDLLNTTWRRKPWLDGLASTLPAPDGPAAALRASVEIVVVKRPLEMAVRSVQKRARSGGHDVPVEAMRKFHEQFEPPTLDEGFARVRTYHNDYDDEALTGGYRLVDDLRAGQSLHELPRADHTEA